MIVGNNVAQAELPYRTKRHVLRDGNLARGRLGGNRGCFAPLQLDYELGSIFLNFALSWFYTLVGAKKEAENDAWDVALKLIIGYP